MKFIKKVGWLSTIELFWTALAALFFFGATILSFVTHADKEIIVLNLVFFLAMGVLHRLSAIEVKLKLHNIDWQE
jgi:hypothetical protein